MTMAMSELKVRELLLYLSNSAPRFQANWDEIEEELLTREEFEEEDIVFALGLAKALPENGTHMLLRSLFYVLACLDADALRDCVAMAIKTKQSYIVTCLMSADISRPISEQHTFRLLRRRRNNVDPFRLIMENMTPELAAAIKGYCGTVQGRSDWLLPAKVFALYRRALKVCRTSPA
jgi:hypothetical protein